MTQAVCVPPGSLGPAGIDSRNNFHCGPRQRSHASCWWVCEGGGATGVPRVGIGLGLLLLNPNLQVRHHRDHLAVFITPLAYLQCVSSPADTVADAKQARFFEKREDHLTFSVPMSRGVKKVKKKKKDVEFFFF